MKKLNLAKNTILYTSALTLQKVMSFVYFIVVARAIGVVNTGKYSFALSFTTIFAMLLDFGLSQVIIRESARDEAKSRSFLANIVAFKLLASVFIWGIIATMVNVLSYPPITRDLVYLSAFVMILDSFSLTFYGVLRGHHNLRFESLGVIINQAMVMIVGFSAIFFHLNLIYFIVAYLVGSIFNLSFSLFTLKRKLALAPWPKFDKQVLKEIFKMALPFAIAGIFVRIYSSLDIVLLSKMANDSAIGWYSAAYKVAFALQFVGVASLAGIYPAFSAYHATNPEKLADAFVKVLKYLTLISLPLAVGVFSLASVAIVPIFGHQYAGSIPALRILILCLPFSFICFPLGAMLNASNRQAWNAWALGLTALVNLILNLVFIPYFSYVGSAWAALLSYVFLFASGVFLVNKILAYPKRSLLWNFIKIGVSATLMGVVAELLKFEFNFIIVIPIAVLVYLSLIYFLGVFGREDFEEVKTMLFKKQLS
jgi:O-antigen/teichoic acid export membrane protein